MNSSSMESLSETIASCVSFLARKQHASGEIPVCLARDRTLTASVMHDGCVMGTIVAHYALRDIHSPEAESVRERAAGFLEQEMVSDGLWRYWSCERLEDSSRSQARIPPDTDDTACALMTLRSTLDPSRVRSGTDAVLESRADDGRFLTWIPDYSGHNDIDSVVNANAVALLGDRPETGAATEYLDSLIENHEDPGSYYYDGGWAPLYYAIARAHSLGTSSLARATRAIVARIEGGNEDLSPMDAALELSALALSGAAESNAARRRVEGIRDACTDGSWRRETYYAGTVPPAPRSVWFGSEELTTAICVEALSTWQTARNQAAIGSPRST